MKHILFITPFFRPNIGGAETRLNDICEELNKAGYKVTVLTYQPIVTRARGKPVEKKENITIRRYGWIGFDLFHKLQPLPLLQTLYVSPVLFFWSLAFFLKNKDNINIIHAAGLNAALIGRILKAIFNKRLIVNTDAIYDLKEKSIKSFFIRWILHCTDKILTLSDPSRQELIRIGINPEKLENQIAWVDQEIFKPLGHKACKEKIGQGNSFLVLFVGRLLVIKGIEDLISVARGTPGIEYLFIGDGPLKYYLKNESENSRNIHFICSVANKELPVYYNAADIFVMPSQYKEGLGRVAVEALSCGTPVIASNLGGIAQILDDSVSILVTPTKENLKTSILYLYDHPRELGKKRSACREFALKYFSVENFQVIVDAYQ